MSDYEHWKGTLKEIEIPKEFDSWEKQVEYLQSQGYHFEDLDLEDKWYSGGDSDCVLVNDKWYKVTKEERDIDDDIIEAEQNGDFIRFELRYYNGGCCFSEALEEAVKKLKGSENKQ